MTVVGTRPEIIRLSAVIERLERSQAIQHFLVYTGQNDECELNQIIFDNFKLKKPDYYLGTARGSATHSLGKILVKIDPILEEKQPDALLILGDTNSCLVALAAKSRQIPIFHMEAGNRCFNQRLSEESNQKIIDHISDINLTYSDISKQYLLNEGFPPDQIIKIGSPLYEVLIKHLEEIEASRILYKLNLTKDNYFLVSAHREEIVDSNKHFIELVDLLNSLASHYQLPIIVPTHHQIRRKIQSLGMEFNDHVKFIKPLGFYDYNHLQVNAKAVLSDSRALAEESSILKFKALNIGESHERPEAIEEASVIMVGLDIERIFQALEVLDSQDLKTFRAVEDYSMPNVSEKVLRIILSYTNYIQVKNRQK